MERPGDHKRFDLAPHSMPDMICGVNGEKLTQAFRPTHVTAVWSEGELIEVKVWGPRVLRHGSLGKRQLDHRWKKTGANGPVKFGDLPKPVADRLLACGAEHGLNLEH